MSTPEPSEGTYSRTPRRRPLRCWAGFHGWKRYRNATFYCTRCPATKGVDPATGKSVVDSNAQFGRWT